MSDLTPVQEYQKKHLAALQKLTSFFNENADPASPKTLLKNVEAMCTEMRDAADVALNNAETYDERHFVAETMTFWGGKSYDHVLETGKQMALAKRLGL